MPKDAIMAWVPKAAMAAGALLLTLIVGLRVGDLTGRAPALAAEPAVVAPRPAPKPAVPAPAPMTTDPLVVRHILDIPGPMKIGDWHWDESAAPADGPTIITIDLDAQVLSIFRDGYEIGTAAILYGVDDKLTPLGTFPVMSKDANHISSIYNAPMPYTMRLTRDGVSIHGSPKMVSGYATHGCVGLPIPFARTLFAHVAVGTPVIITDGKRLGLGQHI